MTEQLVLPKFAVRVIGIHIPGNWDRPVGYDGHAHFVSVYWDCAGELPFIPDAVGSHWSGRVQVDVVAINWQTHDIMLGECKWGADWIDRQVVRDLVGGKTPLLLNDLTDGGKGWKVHYALFARSGFTPAAKTEMQQKAGLLVDLKALDNVLGRA